MLVRQKKGGGGPNRRAASYACFFVLPLLCALPAQAELLPPHDTVLETRPDFDSGSFQSSETSEIPPLTDFTLAPFAFGPDDGIKSAFGSTRENTALLELMRDLAPIVQPMEQHDSGENSQPSSSAASLHIIAASADPSLSEVEVDPSDGRPTVRDVLRTIDRGGSGRAEPSANPASLDEPQNVMPDELKALRTSILDSRFLGELIADVITVNSSIDDTFSVLGFGKFELDDDAQDSGTMGLTQDQSSVANFNVSQYSGADTVAYPVQHLPSQSPEKMDLLRLVLDYLESSTGMMVAIFAAAVFALISTFRVIARLR
jgi:hypothetical protein